MKLLIDLSEEQFDNLVEAIHEGYECPNIIGHDSIKELCKLYKRVCFDCWREELKKKIVKEEDLELLKRVVLPDIEEKDDDPDPFF